MSSYWSASVLLFGPSRGLGPALPAIIRHDVDGSRAAVDIFVDIGG